MAERVLVIDASVAIALIRNEPVAHDVRRLLMSSSPDAGEARLVPFIFWQEVLNTLSGRYRMRGDAILEALYELDQFGVVTRDTTRADLVLILDVMERHRLTAYDATYLALAISADASVVTLDRALAVAAGRRGILLGGPGQVSEPAASYEARPD